MPRWPRLPEAIWPTAGHALGRLRLPLALALLLATLVALAPLLGERPVDQPSASAPSPAPGAAGRAVPAPGAAPLGSGLILLPRGHTLDELDLGRGAERT